MKKLKKKAKKTVKGPTFLDKLPNNQGEWLELCIKFTEKAIHNPPWEEDKFLISQAKRLKEQLAEWRQNESKN